MNNKKISVRMPVDILKKLKDKKLKDKNLSEVTYLALTSLFSDTDLPGIFHVYRGEGGRHSVGITLNVSIINHLDWFRDGYPRSRVIIYAIDRYLKKNKKKS